MDEMYRTDEKGGMCCGSELVTQRYSTHRRTGCCPLLVSSNAATRAPLASLVYPLNLTDTFDADRLRVETKSTATPVPRSSRTIRIRLPLMRITQSGLTEKAQPRQAKGREPRSG